MVQLCACSKPQPADPQLQLSTIGFTVQLPPGMQHALDSIAPEFKPIRTTAFRSDVAQYAAESGGGMQALYAIIGDFDGDGTQDVALEGAKAGDTGLTVIAVLNGDKPRAVEVTRFPEYDADAVGIYLSKIGAGQSGAFKVVNYPDATTVFSYTNGAFTGATGG